ncbi:uncharacterized protein AKAME5_001854900 [Lates japonicus]|uniref:Uncharacterized protein n=1 Tax=Lates japonicus TaxID=270547 RepID=A0AAD3RFW9_LATJO|nr:uncharacterized protein AKAME5_001854900 [Lates japonicus]
MFFKTAPVVVSEELMRQAEALIEPSSQLTPLRLCREACGLVTVEGGQTCIHLGDRLGCNGGSGMYKLFLEDGETIDIPEAMWEPFDPQIKDSVKVKTKTVGKVVTEIKAQEEV